MNLHLALRGFLFAMAILLAFSSPSTAGSNDIEISKFMKTCLQENESFSKERLGLSNTYLVSIGKFETGLGTAYTVYDSIMLKVSETNSSDITILNNTAEAEGMLTDKYTAMNLTYDSLYPTSFEMGEILAMVMRFNDSRQPNEGKCKLWIGTDTPEFDCYDPESCFRACHTPLSNPVASGVGWPFVFAVWEFTNNTKAMDGNLSAVNKNIDDIEGRSGNTEHLLNDLQANLDNIQNSSSIISQSPLFDPWRYSFCWPIKYDRTSLITAKVYAKRLYERMDVVFSIPKQARSISEAGTRRIEICRLNKEKANKPKAHVSFWARMNKDERNFLKLLSAEVSPGPLFPVNPRNRMVNWE